MPLDALGRRIPDIFLDREGRWFVDGEALEHARTCAHYARSVRPAAGGGWELASGHERCPVRVEDTAAFVLRVEPGDGGAPARVALSNDEHEPLTRAALSLEGDGERLYWTTAAGTRARFVRGAHYAMLERLELDDAGAAWLHTDAGRVKVPRP